MTTLEAIDWARRKVPTSTVIASNHPNAIGEVLLQGPYRFRISKELTREEFMRRLRENQTHADAVSGQAFRDGAKLDLETIEDVAEPDPDMTYFYAAELIR